jgi:ADP-ribose pyrophosphatase
MSFEILKREETYHGHAFNVELVQVRLPDGRERSYDLVAHNGSVTIVPLDEEGNILFINQYRLGAGGMLLELPAGVMEDNEEPHACAARELREETGMASSELGLLGDFYLAPGYCNEHMTVFLATHLYRDPLQADEDEFLKVEKIPLARAIQMAQNGEIHDSKTLATLFLALPFLGLEGNEAKGQKGKAQ